ncbi:hypothetical protein QYF36_005024 [Acer negundo]|nr:hypothetical protein QYF36_005024 [Acer negundo]
MGKIISLFTCSHRRLVLYLLDGWETRYHAMNTISGIAKFIDLKTFSDPVNGYLLDDNCVFGVEPCRYILLYPNGNSDGKGNSISLFLGLSLLSIAPGTKLLAKVIMRVKNQMNGKHIEYKDCNLYGPRDSSGLGRTRFISLAKLKDPEQGFLVDDTLIIEAEVTLLGMVLAKS